MAKARSDKRLLDAEFFGMNGNNAMTGGVDESDRYRILFALGWVSDDTKEQWIFESRIEFRNMMRG